MFTNGIGSFITQATYDKPKVTEKDSEKKSEANSSESSESSPKVKSENAAVYERVINKYNAQSRRAADPKLIAKMKADTDNRVAQMQSLVEKMFSKQGKTIGTVDDMWKMLAEGNFEADPETIAQAKEDISEDGYWGVKQTSDRIFDFALALSGGDEEKMHKMQEAVEKGFKEATKTWGKELPLISNDTLKAVNDKFDEFFKEE